MVVLVQAAQQALLTSKMHAPQLPPKTTLQALSDILRGLRTATGASLNARQRQRHHDMAEQSFALIAQRAVLEGCSAGARGGGAAAAEPAMLTSRSAARGSNSGYGGGGGGGVASGGGAGAHGQAPRAGGVTFAAANEDDGPWRGALDSFSDLEQALPSSSAGRHGAHQAADDEAAAAAAEAASAVAAAEAASEPHCAQFPGHRRLGSVGGPLGATGGRLPSAKRQSGGGYFPEPDAGGGGGGATTARGCRSFRSAVGGSSGSRPQTAAARHPGARIYSALSELDLGGNPLGLEGAKMVADVRRAGEGGAEPPLCISRIVQEPQYVQSMSVVSSSCSSGCVWPLDLNLDCRPHLSPCPAAAQPRQNPRPVPGAPGPGALLHPRRRRQGGGARAARRQHAAQGAADAQQLPG